MVGTRLSLWLLRLPGPVETARGVTLEVERHEAVPGRFQACHHRLAVLEEPLHLPPGDVAVVAHPDLGEAEGLDDRLGALDLAECLDCDRRAVGNPRGEAGE